MRKGYVLVLVLAIVIVLSLGILAVIKSTGNLTTIKVRSLQELKAQYLAEAGMTYANWACKANEGDCMKWTSYPSGNSGTKTLSVASSNDVLITVTKDVYIYPTQTYKIVVSVNYPDL